MRPAASIPELIDRASWIPEQTLLGITLNEARLVYLGQPLNSPRTRLFGRPVLIVDLPPPGPPPPHAGGR